MAERSKVIRALGVSTLIYPDKEPVLKLNTTSLTAGEQYGVWGGLPDPGPRPMKLGQTILAFENGPYDDVIDALKAAIDAHTDANKVWSPAELKFLKAEYERKTAPASKKEASKSESKSTKGEPKISVGSTASPASADAQAKLQEQLKKIKAEAGGHKKPTPKGKGAAKDPKEEETPPKEPEIVVGSGTDAEGTPLVPEKEPEITA